MNRFKDFFNKLKNPSVALSAIFSVIAIAVIAFTIVWVCLGNTNSILSYIFYVFSAVALTYLVYIIVYYIPQIRKSVIEQMKKNKFTSEMLESYGFRTTLFANVSFIINLAYAFFQAVFAILSGSVWFGALAAYYIAISLMRGNLIFASRKKKKNSQTFTLEKEVKEYRNTGIYMILLNFALMGAIVQMVLTNQGFKYAGLMIYVMATYTFYKLGMSIYNLVKAKRFDDYLVKAIRNISFADSLVSVLALQTALLYAFSENYQPYLPNSIVGGVVSSAIIGIGIYMLIKGQLQIKKYQKEKGNEE